MPYLELSRIALFLYLVFFGDVLSFCSLSRHSACRCDLLSVCSALRILTHPNRCAHFIPDDGYFMTETLKYNIFLVKSSYLSVSQCCSQPIYYYFIYFTRVFPTDLWSSYFIEQHMYMYSPDVPALSFSKNGQNSILMRPKLKKLQSAKIQPKFRNN